MMRRITSHSPISDEMNILIGWDLENSVNLGQIGLRLQDLLRSQAADR